MNYIETKPNKYHQSWNSGLYYQRDISLIFIHVVRLIILQHFHLYNKLITPLKKLHETEAKCTYIIALSDQRKPLFGSKQNKFKTKLTLIMDLLIIFKFFGLILQRFPVSQTWWVTIK
jgi:hypothetical protein